MRRVHLLPELQDENTQGRQLVAMSVASAPSNNIVTLRGDESVAAAEALMRKHQIRRIPVVDANGRPTGIVSMNDLARHGERAQHGKHAKHDGLDAEMIRHTLAAVSNPSKPSPGTRKDRRIARARHSLSG